jgi:hypothetical protein
VGVQDTVGGPVVDRGDISGHQPAYSGDAERGDLVEIDQQRIGKPAHDHLDDQQPQVDRRRAEHLTSHVDP